MFDDFDEVFKEALSFEFKLQKNCNDGTLLITASFLIGNSQIAVRTLNVFSRLYLL